MLDIGKLYNAASTERLKQLMLVLVPAFTFMAAIIICGYLVLFRQDYSAWAAAFMFFCIIASACALYFGKFIQPKISPHLERNHLRGALR